MRQARATKTVGLVFVLLVAGALAAACGGGGGVDRPVSSTAYKGHESDLDMQNFVAVYPHVVGSRLDDCQTCHRSGDVVYDNDPTDVETLNPCSFCHLIEYPDPDITGGAPAGYRDTLNPYGLGYMDAGRGIVALQVIADTDSDGDTHTNTAEIADGRYPGDAASMPGQTVAPIYTFEWEDMEALAAHTQFLLMNSHRQQFDDYAKYEGVRVADILIAAGVDLSGATGVTVIAPDGYAKDFSLAGVNLLYPKSLYYGNLGPGSFTDPNQGFVTYPPPAHIPPGLAEGGEVPDDQWMLIAHHRDGVLMDPSYLDPVSGKIEGEGPYRLIIPQSTAGSPDRGSRAPIAYGDGWDYDPGKTHNAGDCVRGAVAIRVNPMPAGLEEFDWRNGGWALATAGRLIVYGSGVAGN